MNAMISELQLCTRLSLVFLGLSFLPVGIMGQVEYNWQNSKEGWVSAAEPNFGCTLTALPESMAMRAFNETPVMRSGTLEDDLGITADTYNRVRVTLSNPTFSANPNARLFVYPPESNSSICHFNFPVDTEMEDYATYTINLDDAPTDGVFEGDIARFGLRGPWGVANGDTIFWQHMIIYNSLGCTNEEACNYDPLAEDDNGSCIIVGDACDDGDPLTFNDTYNEDCECAGEPETGIEEREAFAFIVRPNLTGEVWDISSNRVVERLMILDMAGRSYYDGFPKTKDIRLEVSDFPSQVYVIRCFSSGMWYERMVAVNR